LHTIDIIEIFHDSGSRKGLLTNISLISITTDRTLKAPTLDKKSKQTIENMISLDTRQSGKCVAKDYFSFG
jgi:hypothetical protein